MTAHELRATLDRLDLSAAEAGHLLGVHRATVYRWLTGSTSVPIVVELLLRLMVRRGIRPTEVTASRHGRTSARPGLQIEGGWTHGSRSTADRTVTMPHWPSKLARMRLSPDRPYSARATMR